MSRNTYWRTAPISRTCQVYPGISDKQCGQPTTHAYRAMGGGWMALCAEHSKKQRYESTLATSLIAEGERWE